MCLSTITSRHEPAIEEMEGWKMFQRFPSGALCGTHRRLDGTSQSYSEPASIIPVGVWLNASDGEISKMDFWESEQVEFSYTSGFHFYISRRDVQSDYVRSDCISEFGDVVRKVKVRGVHTIGEEWGHVPVGVARQMMVIEEATCEQPTK